MVESIRNGNLYEIIKNKEEAISLANTNNFNFVPNFSFDYLSRKRNIQASNNVLDTLKLLEIISVDLSVSLIKGEILRPDLVCYNPEKRVFVIFEIKRDKLTERQALTEIYAYEQEIRNIIPFIGNSEIQTVIISKDWDTLLEHAVSNYNAWSNKNCLALTISEITPKINFELSLKIANSWFIRGISELPIESYQTLDLNIKGDFEDNNYLPLKIATFVNIIIKYCDRNDIHGFLMVWKDHSPLNKGNWVITFCSVDPLAIFNFCNTNGIKYRESNLTKFIEKFYNDNSSIISDSLSKAISDKLYILKENYDVSFSNFCSWHTKLYHLRKSSNPSYFNFFGIPSDFVIDFTTNITVRSNYMHFLSDLSLDWTHPLVAPILINRLTGVTPFNSGLINCSDIFKLGCDLGLYKYLVECFQKENFDNDYLECSIKWLYINLLDQAIEIAQIYQSSSTIQVAPPYLSNIHENRLESIKVFYEWVHENLLTDESIYNYIFDLSFNSSIILSNYFENNTIKNFLDMNNNKETLSTSIKKLIKSAIINSNINNITTINDSLFSELDFNFSNRQFDKIENFDNDFIIKIFKRDACKSFNKILPPVYHKSDFYFNLSLDFQDLKKNIIQLNENGIKYPAIQISQNGQIGLISLSDIDFHNSLHLLNFLDFNEQVFFSLDLSGFRMVSIKTWEEVKNYFENFPFHPE
ncbi:hypothetical protein IC763_11935 [Acinetobacter seifertii]|nr:hypothetical protein IC763_11935 [Acinetobacter seifertii]